MVKNASTTGDWIIFDTSRDPANPALQRLKPNKPEAEDSNTNNAIDLLSNGFKLRGNEQNVNTNHEFVYAAFAENPFGGENTAPANAR